MRAARRSDNGAEPDTSERPGVVDELVMWLPLLTAVLPILFLVFRDARARQWLASDAWSASRSAK
jgi:hypothetical protein